MAYPSNGFVFGVAEMLEVAVDAFGFAGDADASAVPDELVGEDDPFVLWDHGHQVMLDFFGVLVSRQIQALRKPHDMRVNHDAAGDSEGGAEDDVAGFARNAGEGKDFVHGARDFAAEFLQDAFAGANDRFCFIAEESRGTNFIFQFGGAGVGEIFWRFVFFVKFLGHLIHAHVGALRRENRGNEQLESVFVFQLAGGGGIGFVKLGEDCGDALGVSALGAGGLFA